MNKVCMHTLKSCSAASAGANKFFDAHENDQSESAASAACVARQPPARQPARPPARPSPTPSTVGRFKRCITFVLCRPIYHPRQHPSGNNKNSDLSQRGQICHDMKPLIVAPSPCSHPRGGPPESRFDVVKELAEDLLRRESSGHSIVAVVHWGVILVQQEQQPDLAIQAENKLTFRAGWVGLG